MAVGALLEVNADFLWCTYIILNFRMCQKRIIFRQKFRKNVPKKPVIFLLLNGYAHYIAAKSTSFRELINSISCNITDKLINDTDALTERLVAMARHLGSLW